jgi:hypothetical protein
MIVTQCLHRQMAGAREIANGERVGHIRLSVHSPPTGESTLEHVVDSPPTVGLKVIAPGPTGRKSRSSP